MVWWQRNLGAWVLLLPLGPKKSPRPLIPKQRGGAIPHSNWSRKRPFSPLHGYHLRWNFSQGQKLKLYIDMLSGLSQYPVICPLPSRTACSLSSIDATLVFMNSLFIDSFQPSTISSFVVRSSQWGYLRSLCFTGCQQLSIRARSGDEAQFL